MAGEIQIQYASSKTVYTIIRSKNAQVWNNNTSALEVYNASNWADYVISLVEQGTSGFYAGNFPTAITAGVYSITAYQQLTGSPAVSDQFIGGGDYQWSGTTTLPLSDLATSGQVGQFAPMKIYRGEMIQNFKFYMVSSADHVTPFTSGICSGQILRDGGASFTALQSGAFTEEGNGFFRTNLTSGDLNCNTASLLFTANGVSGGQADPRPMTLVLQRTSGYN
jgi:hypothetical protein